MPPSSKRPQRVRREVVKDVEVPDSSPSRPAKRRKKTDDRAEEKSDPETVVLPKDRTELGMNDEELIATLVQTLVVPEHEVIAIKEHANEVHEKHSKQGVQAYAKLAGKDWTFYIKRLKNNIGRPPEGYIPPPVVEEVNGIEDLDKEEPGMVHVDLGPSKMVSRVHAQIEFDNNIERWFIHVAGRNGIKVDTHLIRREQIHYLTSGEIIDIGGVEMMFVLPEDDGSLKASKFYLRRAGMIAPDDGTDVKEEDLTTSGPPSSQAARGQNGSNGPLNIAPAPPDYRRPGTPISAGPKGYPTGKTPGYAGSTMLMNAEDVDLSLDSNQHIKPSYSYSQLISQAILDTDNEKLTLSGIYNFITDKYAYYRHQLGGGWQNSIRHNLSLNKAFEKVARETNEPGKGMKWQIKNDHRDEMARQAVRGGRGGHRGSPGTPNPNRASRGGLSSSVVRRPGSKQSESPALTTYTSNANQFTPDQMSKNSEGIDHLPGDGSPLPRHRRSAPNTYGISDNAPNSPPVLTSSYMPEEGNSFATPAPHRVHPRLAPPSTAQRPSQHMPTSSPAPFWRYADIGGTPMGAVPFSSSPAKGPLTTDPPSSPVPIKSPTRNGGPVKQSSVPEADDVEEEDHGIDLTRGFQSIGSYHAPPAAIASGAARS